VVFNVAFIAQFRRFQADSINFTVRNGGISDQVHSNQTTNDTGDQHSIKDRFLLHPGVEMNLLNNAGNY